MTEGDVENMVVEMVTGPVKATELAAKLAVKLCEERVEVRVIGNIPLIFEKLVKEGRLMEIEYVLKELDYRIKSVYFPAGTQLIYKGIAFT